MPPRVDAGEACWRPGAARSPGRADGKAPVSQAVSTPPMSRRAATPGSRRPARRGTGGAGGRTGSVRGWAGAASVDGSTVGALAESDAGPADGLVGAVAKGATGVLACCGRDGDRVDGSG